MALEEKNLYRFNGIEEEEEEEESKSDEEGEETQEESQDDTEKKSEEDDNSDDKSDDSKDSEEKSEFIKGDEPVSASKYNQAVRKARELELEKRELEKALGGNGSKKVEKKEKSDDKDEDDDWEDDKSDESEKDSVSKLVDQRLKPVLDRLSQKEADDRKKQRSTFFEKHPQYLKNPELWQELLEELDNSINPNSKDDHFTQLEKAHRILNPGESKGESDSDRKKREMASESSSKGDGAKKSSRKSEVDERADRLTKRMPLGFVYKEK